MLARRCALSIALCLAPGCFHDDGADLTQAATSSPTGSSTGQASTSTTGSEPTSTTGLELTSTGGSTTAEPMCVGEPMCAPGDIMGSGELCEPCGRTQSVCQPDCTWGAPACLQDLSSCVFWVHSPELKTWTRVALPQPPPPHAPTEPIAAAFELMQEKLVIALTQTTYHVLSEGQEWTASGGIGALFPGFEGPVLHAFSHFDGELNGHLIVLGTGMSVQYYWLTVDSLTADYVGDDACCGSWNDTINPGSVDVIRDIFTHYPNTNGWVTGEYTSAECLEGMSFTVSEYAAWVAPTAIYVEETDLCNELFLETPYANFGPFTAPGGPPGDLVGGVALLGESLYVFAGE